MGRKTGQLYPCVICGTPRWRTPSDVRRNIRQTCSKECLSKKMSGTGNPFWGKLHPPEVIAKMIEKRRTRPGPRKRTGPPKGYRHTPEAREKITAALKERWRDNRDRMLAMTAANGAAQRSPLSVEPRYRNQFTPWQRKEWKGDACAWCQTNERLVLDHVIPIMAGGTNVRTNAQTLCQPCNLWKMTHFDRVLTVAILGGKSG